MSKGIVNANLKCVCISCFNYYDTRMHAVIDYFSNKGMDVTYITSDFSHFEKKRFSVEYPKTIQIHVSEYKENISIRRIISHLMFSYKVSRLLKRIGPDLIYCMFPPNSLVRAVSNYRKLSKCKVIFDGYDLWPAGLVNEKRLKPIMFLLKAWGGLRDNNIGNCNMIVAVSEGMQDYFRNRFNLPVKLLYPQLIPQFPNYSYDIDKEISFCYLGNINHIPDLDLISNITKIIRKTKNVSVHVIGEGEYLNELLSKLEPNGVKCYTHGVVMDMNEKIKIYELCHFGINLPNVKSHSTMSLKSVEYMSVGLPYLNTGGGDNWQIVERYGCGFNIDRNNVQKTVEQLLSLTSSSLKTIVNDTRRAYEELFNTKKMDELFSDIFVDDDKK